MATEMSVVHNDPVEDQVQEMMGRIPDALAKAGTPLGIRQLAHALDHHTDAPWCVVFAVERLEAAGVLRRDTTRGNRAPWRWALAPAPASPGPERVEVGR